VPLFRVEFRVQLLDEREAIFEGRCSLRDADRERRSAAAIADRVTSSAQLDAIERNGFPWGRRSPKKCGGEMVRDLKDLAGELAAAHHAAGIWKAAAKGYRADLARLGVEMGVTCGDDDEETDGLVP